MTLHDGATHDELRALLAEQALGITDGRDRVELLEHVASCPTCAAELEDLGDVADLLMHLAPGVEPPVGFETRTVERIQGLASAPPRRRSRTPLLAAAAAVLLLAFLVGWVSRGVTTHPGGAQAIAGRVVERGLVRQGRSVGAAYVYTGSPSWMFVTVSARGVPSAVRCTLVTSGGRRQSLGTFWLVAGKGAWGTRLPVGFRAIRQIELSTVRGAPIARLGPAAWSYQASEEPA